MTTNYRIDKIERNRARKKIAEIVNKSPANVKFSQHSLEELRKDGLTTIDAWNVLKSSDSRIFNEGELEKGSYRYRLETNFIMVVVAFMEDGSGLVVVTSWDKRKSCFDQEE